MLIIDDGIPSFSVNRARRIRDQFAISGMPIQRLAPFPSQKDPARTLFFLTATQPSSRKWACHGFLTRRPRSLFTWPGRSVPMFYVHNQICHTHPPKAMVGLAALK